MEKRNTWHYEPTSTSGRLRWSAIVAAASLAALATCTPGMADKLFGDPRFTLGLTSLQSFYTEPGVDRFTQLDKKIDLKLVDLIEEAEKSVDVAVYNLSRESIIEALTLAEERGIQVRMVGDVDEVVTDGYRKILRTPIPFSLGNTTAIQHNKFAVIDKKHLFMGTGNITTSGFIQNNENFLIMESESMARDFTNEFEQMYFGKYGSKKAPLTSNFYHRIDFTNLELYFSPYNGQEAMDRLIQLVNSARTSVKYMIFAHTHDELSTAKIRAAKRGVLVRGIHDSTFINGTSEEAPRFWGAAQHMPNLQVRRDGNENTATIGLASHGGKLHCKSMIIDDEIICTGSFNWSNNAVENNDENMVCVFNPVIAQTLARQWQGIWDVSQPVTNLLRHPSGDTAQPGEVVISEVMWAGSYSNVDSFLEEDDDWIELRNMTTRDIDISHWSISWDANETVFYPIPDEYNWFKDGVASRHYFTGKLIIPAGGYFLLKGQNKAIDNADNKISGVKNFELASSGFQVRLYDVTMTLIDQAGNGDPPLAGGSRSSPKVSFSMERFFWPTGTAKAGQALPGASAGSWYTSNGNNGTAGVVTDPTIPDCATTTAVPFRNVCATGQVLEENIGHTVGTPNYGSSSVPASQAYGAHNNSLNTPLYAWSTGSTSATIQMRWGLTEKPSITSGALCGGACAAANVNIDANDPSLVHLTNTTGQTVGNAHALNVTAGTKDVSNPDGTGTIFGGLIAFAGGVQAQASMRISLVMPSRSSSEDVIELTATSSGTLKDLGVYYFEPGFGTFPPVLLYRLSDVRIAAGEKVRVMLDKPGWVSDDRVVQGRCLLNSADCSSGTTYDIAYDGGSNGVLDSCVASTGCSNSTYDVFSSIPGIQETDGIIFIGTTSTGTPMDAMCFSDRSGDILEGLMKGGFRKMYGWPASVYPMAVFAVDNNNDFLVESQCADYSRGGSANNALMRTNLNATGVAAWRCENSYNILTGVASNEDC